MIAHPVVENFDVVEQLLRLGLVGVAVGVATQEVEKLNEIIVLVMAPHLKKPDEKSYTREKVLIGFHFSLLMSDVSLF